MTRRPGIRVSTETRASAVAGPIADLLSTNLDQRDVLGRVADDVRAAHVNAHFGRLTPLENGTTRSVRAARKRAIGEGA